MTADVEAWLGHEGEQVLRRVGIQEGATILDFGCGEGVYSIPAARIAGLPGRLYALDKDASKLEQLKQRSQELHVGNIEVVHTSAGLKVPFPNRFFNTVLLYDVLHCYYFAARERAAVLEEVYRVLTPAGLLSVYPEHMSVQGMKQEIRKAGFVFVAEHTFQLIHEDHYTQDPVINFRKSPEAG